MVTRWCVQCDEEYSPVEYAAQPVDADEPVFCSTECEEEFQAAEDASEAYNSAGYPAPVH